MCYLNIKIFRIWEADTVSYQFTTGGSRMIRNYFSQKKNLYSSAFLMILLINLCSIVVLTIFNYYVFHRMNDKAYLKSFISYNQRITDLAFNNIDKQIMQSALTIPQAHFSPIKENDPILLPQEVQIIKSPEKIRALVTEMNKIKKNYAHIEGIDLYYEGTKTVVTDFVNVHFPQDEDLIDQYLPWYKDIEKEDTANKFIWQPEGVYIDKNPMLTYIHRISHPKWNGQDILVAIHINPLSFGEYIDKEEGDLAILSKDGSILYNSNEGPTVTYKIEDILRYADKTPFDIESENGPVTIFHTVSPTSGLMYFYTINNSRFYEEYNVTNHMFIMSFIISIAFNILVLVLISYYNYITYRKRVLTLSKNAGIVIEKSDRSFDGSLNVLTKEITMLNETINSSKALLFQSAVRYAILDRNKEEAYEYVSPYLTGDSVCTFLLQMTAEEIEKLSIEEIQEHYPIGKEIYNVLFTTMNRDGLIAVLIFEQSKKDEICKSFIQDMTEHLGKRRMVYGLTFLIEKDGIVSSYKSAVEAARYRYIFTEEDILSYEELHIEKRKSGGRHLRIFEALEKDIHNENFLDCKLRMEMLMTSFKSGNYTIDYCISTLRDVITLLYQTMEQHQLDMWGVFGYDIRAYYKEIPDIDKFYEWSCNLCEVILKNIRQKNKMVGTDTQVQLTKLIEEHLENNISLDFLADQLHMRQDTASRMFRQVMGKSYTDYIKARKLERAIELMKEDYNMKDIAEKLGYSSAQYFIKVFKESYGTTPYQYKKNYEKEL